MDDYMKMFNVLDSLQSKNIKIEVLEYKKLSGSQSGIASMAMHYAKESGSGIKHIRVTLNNGEIKLEAGALYFLKGNIQMKNTMGGVTGAVGKLFSAAVTKEKAFTPTYFGTGELFLEPTNGHYILLQLENEEIIVDKGMFHGCETTIEVSAAMQSNISSAVMGGEGLFQTRIKGSGLCVLTCPVPETEIIKYNLNGDTLQVDGNFALLRSGGVQFTVEKSTKSLFGTLTSGEGLLQTFRGHGEVWIAPTQAIYNRIYLQGVSGLSNTSGSSNTRV